jgi:hypothetical protein
MQNIIKNKLTILAIAFLMLPLLVVPMLTRGDVHGTNNTSGKLWTLQGIDTVKYSRDVAREKSSDTSFDQTIDAQVKAIADTGATHLSIGTPYDEEFIPFLSRWVAAARKHNLNVWFRGNFSGWENWFGYEDITRAQHLDLTREFILANGELFEDGDIFTSCTECENGGPGDPRFNGDAAGHKQFLIDEYEVAGKAFRNIGKNVKSNYFPMNGDVARLIMDKETTKALGGIVVVDHYVGTSDRLVRDIGALANQSGGEVVLGEFGAPIPDIHGNMTEAEQAAWLEGVMSKLAEEGSLIGVNYWTNVGGSTELWDSSLKPTEAASTLESYYNPQTINGSVFNEINEPIVDAQATAGLKTATSNSQGKFSIARTPNVDTITIAKAGYGPKTVSLSGNVELNDIVLIKESEGFIFKLKKHLLLLLGQI